MRRSARRKRPARLAQSHSPLRVLCDASNVVALRQDSGIMVQVVATNDMLSQRLPPVSDQVRPTDE